MPHTLGLVRCSLAVAMVLSSPRIGWAQLAPTDMATQALEASLQVYRQRYPLASPDQKLVDENGKGFEALTGVRNFRAVLPGLVYRGGANNRHRVPPRDNRNPLPPEALANLCKEGFGQAASMYKMNFSTAAKTTSCVKSDGTVGELAYEQDSALTDHAALRRILTLIHQRITGEDHRPVYLHCWNGSHASGFASAIVLRQFCEVGGKAAAAYWDRNRDGAAALKEEEIMNRIRDFKPIPELAISQDLRQRVCPQLAD